MSPRLTDWSLALAAALALASGVVSLVSGSPAEWMIFALHGTAGLWLLLLLWGKLRRVWPRLLHPRRYGKRTVFGILALLLAALALGSGIGWSAGGVLSVMDFNLLNWHIVLGAALTFMLVLHMFARAKRLRERDLVGRRQVLRFGALALGAATLWPAQQIVQRVIGLPGAHRRFTGSREAGSYGGNAFPSSSWVADAPRPIAPEAWRLSIGGAVAQPCTLTYDEVVAYGDMLEATLDCTGGFYSTQRWRGAQIGRLLDHAEPLPGTGWVSVVSVTGYRWSLPLAEARTALLATHVGGEALRHEHGAPARLVAPSRRGFQWVKWVVHLEALTAPDFGQVIAIHTSSLTPEGRGER
jgi:DMSO/TMAO reductase YedYZ molybdopterin-dependent catalytic subunit